MSLELGVPGESESLESRFSRLIEHLTQTQQSRLLEYQAQTQHQLEMYQAQNQRQLGELASSITKLMQTLNKNAKLVEISAPNSAVIPSVPQPGYEQVVTEATETMRNSDSEKDTPPEIEQEPLDQQDKYNENLNTYNEGTEEENHQEIIEEASNPCLLEQENISNAQHHSQHLHELSSPPATPTMDSPTAQNCGNHVALDRKRSLHIAAETGDWARAAELFAADPGLIAAVITNNLDTALLIAVEKKRWVFAEKLIECMPREALQLQEIKYGRTALHFAAREGNKKIAEALVNKNPIVTQIRNQKDEVPLTTATLCKSRGQKEIIKYLCAVTEDKEPSPISGPDGASLLCSLIDSNFYDIALDLFKRCPELIMDKTKRKQVWPFEAIAERPFAFRSGCKLNLWQSCIYPLIQVDTRTLSRHCIIGDIENPSKCTWADKGIIFKFFSTILAHITQVPCIEQLRAQKLMHEEAAALVKNMVAQLRKLTAKSQALSFFRDSCALKIAIKDGITEIVEECLSNFPNLMWIETKNKTTLIQIAIEERNERIINLICQTSTNEDDKNELLSRGDTHGNGILHFAAKLASRTQLTLISGAVLQMQREIQFFKGIEKLVDKNDRLVRNNAGYTAQFIFMEEHNGLMKEGEKWMKDTSHSCMVVAALIATVAFAAAFTVPGGNSSDETNKGIPIFLNEISFMVFAVADALALFSSVTSILMFLAILTSRYAAEDFLTSLPTKLIIGLGTLFFSIAATMIAFSATLCIVLSHKVAWVLTPISLFACVPVTLFAWLQFPLLVEMVWSTYSPRLFQG